MDMTKLASVGAGAITGKLIDYAGNYIDKKVVYGQGATPKPLPIEVYKRYPSMILSLGGGAAAILAASFMRNLPSWAEDALYTAGFTAIAIKGVDVVNSLINPLETFTTVPRVGMRAYAPQMSSQGRIINAREIVGIKG